MINRLSENYWFAKNRNQVEVYTKEININSHLFIAVKNLFEIYLADIKEPKQKLRGTDGTTYYFSQFSDSLISGETWSPSNGALSSLVSVCNEIILTSKIGFTNRNQEKLISQIEETIELLK